MTLPGRLHCPCARARLRAGLCSNGFGHIPRKAGTMEWYLVIMLDGKPNAAFDYYPTKAACQAALAPLTEHGLTNVTCLKTNNRLEGCETGQGYCFSFVNGPSAGVWPGILDSYNERARRGLWHHDPIDLWRYELALAEYLE